MMKSFNSTPFCKILDFAEHIGNHHFEHWKVSFDQEKHLEKDRIQNLKRRQLVKWPEKKDKWWWRLLTDDIGAELLMSGFYPVLL